MNATHRDEGRVGTAMQIRRVTRAMQNLLLLPKGRLKSGPQIATRAISREGRQGYSRALLHSLRATSSFPETTIREGNY